MSSFIPLDGDIKKEKDIIVDKVSDCVGEKHSWRINDTPLNEFKTEYLATMSFPTLFPDGKGDLMNTATMRNISENETEFFALKIKHLIRFGEYIDNRWSYRFASHSRFSYWAYNILYRRRILGQENFCIKQNPGEASMTIEELRSMLSSGSYAQVMSKLMHYPKNVTGTNAYWNQVKEELKATITQVGASTIFWTLSCAEFHWPEFHSSFGTENPTNEQLRCNVLNNPPILDWLFTQRIEQFVKSWLYKCLDASWHWYPYEFAVQRGYIHCHGLAKLNDDPDLCNLTKKALTGFLASETKQTDDSLTAEEIATLDDDIQQGKQEENQVCKYVDSLMSTVNPYHPDEFLWIKPDIHPSKLQYDDISETEWDDDYIDLLNMVQRHTKCNSAYCLRQSKDGTQHCRFDYPIDLSEKTHLEFEKIHSRDGKVRYKAKVVTERNDSRLNRHQRLQLQGWRANCDINIVINYHSCLEYLTKYASKGERLSSVARDAFISVVSKLSDNMDTNQTIKKLMMKAVGQRDMSAQEVMHQILSLKLFSSSFQIVSVSLEGSRRIKLENNDIITEPSIIDHYANRILFKDDHPEVINLNFQSFVSKFYVKNNKLHKRPKMVIVRTFPNYHSNPKDKNFGLFCKFQLLKYKP